MAIENREEDRMLKSIDRKRKRKPIVVLKNKRKKTDLDCLSINDLLVKQNEDSLHKDIATFLTYALKDPRIDWETIEVSAGGNSARQSLLKARGVKEGTPDILITFCPHIGDKLHFILRLEIKTTDGQLQKSQKKRIPELQAKGQVVEVVRSVRDVQDALERYFIPYKARVL